MGPVAHDVRPVGIGAQPPPKHDTCNCRCHICLYVVLGGQWGGICGNPMECLGFVKEPKHVWLLKWQFGWVWLDK